MPSENFNLSWENADFIIADTITNPTAQSKQPFNVVRFPVSA
jgi:hypothetical protein